jgi:hypothetical protein
MTSDGKRKHYESAINYVASRREKSNARDDKTFPLNRGDILIIIMLIDQDMNAEPSADLKRLTAIRGKLGDLVADAPEMPKEEAQKFR